jgi:hypothetical protein
MNYEMINMKNDNVDVSPLTFKLYELKILHNQLIDSLEEYPEFPMNKVILLKLNKYILEQETKLVVDALFGDNNITPEDEEQNYWDHVESQYADDLPF